MTADVLALVGCESPSHDRAAVARSADLITTTGTRLVGVPPERIERDGRIHLRWRFGAGPRRVVVLAHHDTVWPIGSLATHPAQVRDGVLRGPGGFDMKTGIVQALTAIGLLADGRPDRLDGLSLLVTADEEIGSPTSRELIETEAAGCAAAFVLEAAGPDGALKTGRKGTSWYHLRITGRAAHAGLEPERGANAGIELARQILSVVEFADPAAGTTVTPTTASAGSTANTVPATAGLDIDVRVWTVAEQHRVDRAMQAVAATVPGCSVVVEGGINRPPMDPASGAGLFERARTLAGTHGLGELAAMSVGGGSDGNFTAGIGVPTLDGLGACGGGAHADDEHVLLEALPGRTALLVALLADQLGLALPGTP
ncbi:M20 family metallopeptidase [Nakamurella flavida]|uniref:M20 family metallopeptidase n=1 Tax=Nakamurella flavida TaxID=363630 RepID=A0A938YJJ9_9ACTN|nr:M20 family metallopeptidase [Nakamurella flavida]MBM9475766.1 M20 family metallopeptidase [Nakamurella flavida]